MIFSLPGVPKSCLDFVSQAILALIGALIGAVIGAVVLSIFSDTTCSGTCTISTSELVVEHGGGSYEKRENVPSDLPKLIGPFVGREKQVNEIVRYLKSESVHIVTIYGPPAFGKSTLAIHVGYKMVGSGVPVRYIDMTESNVALFGRSTRRWMNQANHSLALHNVTQVGAKSDKHEVPSYENWKELLNWAKLIKTHTVLLLDNCDGILHEHRKEFYGAIHQMQQFSWNGLKIIITSQEHIKVLDASYAFSVSELSPNDSVKLLQELAGSNQVTTAEGKELASLVGNCPLALKVTAMLLRDHSSNASRLARKLKRALLSTISDRGLPQQYQFTALMDIAYNFLDKRAHNCSHYLSFFPGSFDSEAAVHILGLSGIPSQSECLDILLWRSLIEEYVHGNDIRFKIHKLIKTYFIEKLASTPQTNGELLGNLFNNSFRKYYSKYVTTFAQHIQNTDGSDAAMYKFKSEAHNVQYLLQILLNNQLKSKFEAATLTFAYHERMLPEDNSVYRKVFYVLDSDKVFYFVSKVLGMNCAVVYINVLHNLYLSTCKNEPQSCIVFSCDQLYNISHRIERLRISIGNFPEAAAVKRLIDFDYSAYCMLYVHIYFSGLVIAAMVVQSCLCGHRQPFKDQQSNNSESLITFFFAAALASLIAIVLYYSNITIEWLFIFILLTLTPVVLHYKLANSVCKALLIFCSIGVTFVSSSAWITLSLMFYLTAFHVAYRTTNLLNIILCFLLLCSFALWFSANISTEYWITFILFSGVLTTWCCRSRVLNKAELFLLRLSLLTLTISHIRYFISLFVVYVDIDISSHRVLWWFLILFGAHELLSIVPWLPKS